LEEDKHLLRYKGLIGAPELKPKVITAATVRGLPSHAICTCGERSTWKVCPACHNDLPSDFGKARSYTIALIGAKDVGKSHYVTVLIHELKNRIGRDFGFPVTSLDDQTRKRYNDNLRRLFEQNEVMSETTSAMSNAEVRYPMIYQIKPDRHFFGLNLYHLASKLNLNHIINRVSNTSTFEEVNVVFFDTAGEDLSDLSVMKTVNKYIANADGLILLLDPLQVPVVRDKLKNKENVRLPDAITDQQTIVDRVINLIQAARSIEPSSKINIPVAVAFSKMDALDSIVDRMLLSGSSHRGYFDIDDAEKTHELFIGYLDQWFGGNMLRQLERYFVSFAFFGFSTLGSSPDDSGRLSKGISPYRIEDPLLWILYKKGIIKGKRSRR